MSNIIKIKNVTKIVEDDIIFYYFFNITATVYTTINQATLYEVYTQKPFKVVEFENLTETYGATNIEEYFDLLATMGIYSNERLTTTSQTSYGNTIVAFEDPVISGNATYGFIPANFRTYSDLSGTANTVENMLSCSSNSTVGSYGAIRSFRSTNYKVGLGTTTRFSGIFPNPAPNTWSGIGLINLGDELSFGYNGLTFGIWHRYNGKGEVRYLQITTPASGSENATIIINSVVYVCPITSGTTQKNAREITTYLEANVPTLNVDQVDNTVRIAFTSDGAKTGTFSMSSATAIGTFSQITAGVTKTSVHIPVSSWSQPSSFLSELDPTKGNTYSIVFKNGFGNIKFYIENPNTGDFELVHIIKWTNTSTYTNVINASLHLGCYATSVGVTTGTSVKVAYIAGFITGEKGSTRNPRAVINTHLSVGTTLTNILSIRNPTSFNGIANQQEVEPILLTLTNDGNKNAEFELRVNPTVAGYPNYQTTGSGLMLLKDINGTTVTQDGTFIAAFSVARLSSQSYLLKDLGITLPPSLSVVIAARMISGVGDLSASLTYRENT